MNLYLISQTVNADYNTYDSAVVCAESEEAAKKIHPDNDLADLCELSGWQTWCQHYDVTVQRIGIAELGTNKGVICASFNAG